MKMRSVISARFITPAQTVVQVATKGCASVAPSRLYSNNFEFPYKRLQQILIGSHIKKHTQLNCTLLGNRRLSNSVSHSSLVSPSTSSLPSSSFSTTATTNTTTTPSTDATNPPSSASNPTTESPKVVDPFAETLQPKRTLKQRIENRIKTSRGKWKNYAIMGLAMYGTYKLYTGSIRFIELLEQSQTDSLNEIAFYIGNIACVGAIGIYFLSKRALMMNPSRLYRMVLRRLMRDEQLKEKFGGKPFRIIPLARSPLRAYNTISGRFRWAAEKDVTYLGWERYRQGPTAQFILVISNPPPADNSLPETTIDSSSTSSSFSSPNASSSSETTTTSIATPTSTTSPRSYLVMAQCEYKSNDGARILWLTADEIGTQNRLVLESNNSSWIEEISQSRRIM